MLWKNEFRAVTTSQQTTSGIDLLAEAANRQATSYSKRARAVWSGVGVGCEAIIAYPRARRKLLNYPSSVECEETTRQA